MLILLINIVFISVLTVHGQEMIQEFVILHALVAIIKIM